MKNIRACKCKAASMEPQGDQWYHFTPAHSPSARWKSGLNHFQSMPDTYVPGCLQVYGGVRVLKMRAPVKRSDGKVDYLILTGGSDGYVIQWQVGVGG